MPKFLIQGSYTSEGLKGLAKDKASGRKAIVTKMLQKVGVKVEAFYFSFGSDDVLLIVDAPDNATVTAVSIAVSSTGVVSLHTTPLMTAAEVDEALAKSIPYTAPGQ
jgi:uncharacterized protein with GYD domain